MRRLPRVRDAMDTEVPTLSPDTDVYEAIDFLLENHVTGAPVLAGDELVGIVTESDLLKLLTRGVGENRASGKVRDFMTTEVVTVPSRMDVYYAAGIFLTHVFRRLPVVDDGRLVGAITRYDILRAISKNH